MLGLPLSEWVRVKLVCRKWNVTPTEMARGYDLYRYIRSQRRKQ